MMYEDVMAKLDATKESLRDIAARTGIPYSTLTRIARRDTKDPSVHDIEALYRDLCAPRQRKRA